MCFYSQMNSTGRILRVLAFVAGLITFCPSLIAQSADDPPASTEESRSGASSATVRSSGGNDNWPDTETELAGLPEPPDAIRELMQRANVKLYFYDSGKYPRQYAGETRFSTNYESKMNYRWRLIRIAGGKRQLVIRTNFRDVRFTDEHRMLIPIRFADADLYHHRLVLHEFDHVRISADQRFQRLFERLLRAELGLIRIDLDENLSKRELDSLADKTVKEKTAAVFQRMIDLIEIRYVELDRLTRHGNAQPPEGYFTDGVLAADILAAEDDPNNN